MSMLNRIARGSGTQVGIDPVTGAVQAQPWSWRAAGGLYADAATGRDVWLYMALATTPFVDEDPSTRLGIGAPIANLLEDIGELSTAPAGGVRHLSTFREIHLLSVSWDVTPVPPPGVSDALAAFQAEAFAGLSVPDKTVLIGVKLRAGLVLSGGISAVLARLFDWADESAVVDFAAYDTDRARVEEILARNGATAMTAEQAARLESWFNDGDGPEAYMHEHPDRVEVVDRNEEWQFSAVVGFKDPVRGALAFDWAAAAAVKGASVISVRASLEPASVTRTRARRAQRRLREQIEEQHSTGDLDRSEDWQRAAWAKQIEDYYADPETKSQLTDVSILLARPLATGKAPETFQKDLENRTGVKTVVLTNRQIHALDEMMPCSTRRLGLRRPFSQDMNPQALAYAGFTAFSGLGDDTGPFIGLATPDRVPVYLDPAASARTNQPPTLAIVGQPGSGKTFLSQSISLQAVLDGRRAVFINPKSHDSLRPFADAIGGETVSLAQLEGGEAGAFDPFRFAPTPEMAAEIAAQHILSVLTGFTEAQELALADGLRRGAENGARCVTDALEYVTDDDVRDLVRSQASNTLFALGVAHRDRGPLGVTAGLTLVEFDRPFDLPSPAATFGEHTRDQRIAMAAIRLVTRASIEILMRPRTDGTVGRDGGVLVVDEAWVFLQHPSSQAVLDRLAREGRSMGLLLVLATQKVADVLNGGIAGYLSRVMALRLTERKEAEAALTLAGFEPTEDLIGFLHHDAGPGDPQGKSPGRPPQGLHRDAHGRRAIVELGPTPPRWALTLSTNPEDRAARSAQLADGGPGMVDS